MQPWKTKVVCAGKYRPRQFEYHPLQQDVLVFGTLKGEAVVVNVESNRVLSSIRSGLSLNKHDAILGLSWLRRSPARFVAGSACGYVGLADTGISFPCEGKASAEDGTLKHINLPRTSENLTHRRNAVQEAGGGSGRRTRMENLGVTRAYEGGKAVRRVEEGRIVKDLTMFRRLTSVHVNCTDDHGLASGHTHGVRLFDLATGQVVRELSDIHSDHINISRFTNHSPFVFATSSFDGTVKTWDSRVCTTSPTYICKSDRGHVMLSFSPDDTYLLTSAVDNEVKQYLSVDGRLHMKLALPKTGLEDNFTRSYYTASGRFILSGASEEQSVRLHCAQTGRQMSSAEMYPGRKHGSLYVQSLRGDPHDDFRFSVLVNYHDTAYPLEIVNVDMSRNFQGERTIPVAGYGSVGKLSSDLARACTSKCDADTFVVARNKSRYAAHRAILSCRSPILANLIDRADVASLDEGTESSADVNKMGGETTSMLSPLHLYLPTAVVPEVVPIVLEYLYTDELEMRPENSADGHAEEYLGNEAQSMRGYDSCERNGFTSLGKTWERTNNDANMIDESTARQDNEVHMYEAIMEAARALGLERLFTLVEARCRALVSNRNVVAITSMAYRQDATQLLDFCIHYLSATTKLIDALHGSGSFPASVQAKVDDWRRASLYSLSRESLMRPMPQTFAEGAGASAAVGAASSEGSREQGGDTESNGSHEGNGADHHSLFSAMLAAAAALGNARATLAGHQPGQGLHEQDAEFLENVEENEGGEAGMNNDEEGEDDFDDDFVVEDMMEEGQTSDEEDVTEEHEEDIDIDIVSSNSSDSDGLAISDSEDAGSSEPLSDRNAYLPWTRPQRCSGDLPRLVRRHLVPTMKGHTAVRIFDSDMLVLGGGNKRQLHSTRFVLIYDPIERAWSKVATRGPAPPVLISHSCTALDPPWLFQRHMLVFAGSSTYIEAVSPKAQLRIFDALTLQWSKPVVKGDKVAARTRHTAVAVYADHDEYDRAQAEYQWRDSVQDCSGSTRGYKGSSGGSSASRPKTKSAGTSCATSGNTDIIFFGGFSRSEGLAYNDILVLNVKRTITVPRCTNSSLWNSGAHKGCTRGDISSVHKLPARRHGHCRQRTPPGSDGDSDAREWNDERYRLRGTCRSDTNPSKLRGSHGNSGRAVHRESGEFRCRWITPAVRGVPPSVRLAHAAAMVRIGDGTGHGKETCMVVFGGVGISHALNDVHVLGCSNMRALYWENEISPDGRQPEPRFGHSMEALPSPPGCTHAKMAVFGGTDGGTRTYNDLFLLTLSRPTRGELLPESRLRARWESISVQGPVPCPRGRQSLCSVNGEVIVFGGSFERTTPIDDQERVRSREVYAHAFHIRPELRRRALMPRKPEDECLRDIRTSHVQEIAMAAARASDPRTSTVAARRLAAVRVGSRHSPEQLNDGSSSDMIDTSTQSGEPWKDRSEALIGMQDRPAPRSVGKDVGPKSSREEAWSNMEVIWECIRPETYVYEVGPEPPVFVKPTSLREDMGKLIGSSRHADMRFIFQDGSTSAPSTPAEMACSAPLSLTPASSPRTTTKSTGGARYRVSETGSGHRCAPEKLSTLGTRYKSSAGQRISLSDTYRASPKRTRQVSEESEVTEHESSAVFTTDGTESACQRRRLGVTRATGDGEEVTRLRRPGDGSHGDMDDERECSVLSSDDINRSLYQPGDRGAKESVRIGEKDHKISPWRWDGGSDMADVPPGDSANETIKSDLLESTSSGGRHPTRSQRCRTESEVSTSGAFSSPRWCKGKRCAPCEQSPERSAPSISSPAGRHNGASEMTSECSCTKTASTRRISETYSTQACLSECRPAASPRSPAGEEISQGKSGDSRDQESRQLFRASGQSACTTHQRKPRTIVHDAASSNSGYIASEAQTNRTMSTVDHGGRSVPLTDAGETMVAHRVLLALRSEPMRAMFGSGMRESFAAEAIVKGVRAPVFKSLLTYLYTDTLQLDKPDDIMELLAVADQYNVGELMTLCEAFLQEVMDCENAGYLYHYADTLRMPVLEQRVLAFMLRNWSGVTRSDAWRNLPPQLRSRANTMRTMQTHLYMYGHKDHVDWINGLPLLGEWVKYSEWANPLNPLAEEMQRIRNRLVGDGEEGFVTAGEEEGDSLTDSSNASMYYSPRSQRSHRSRP